MKKLFSITIAFILLAITATPALACGGHGAAAQTARYSVCPVENCLQLGVHPHNRISYAAHYYGDGHTYHKYCSIEDCTKAGYHSHTGVCYFGHIADDGHDYHGYCDIANCAQGGYHAHSGEYCFAHTADDGHSYHNRRGGHH